MTTDIEQAPSPPVGPDWQPSTRRTAAIVVVAGVVGLGIFLLFGVLDSIVIACLLAFLIEPLFRFAVTRLHMKRWLAILIVYLVVAVIAFGAILLLPILLIGSLAQIDFKAIVESVDQWITDLATTLQTSTFLGVDLSGLSGVVDSIGSSAGQVFEPGQLLDAFESALVAAAGFVGLVIGVISSLFFIIIIAVYLSVDNGRLLKNLPALAPARYRGEVVELGRRLNGVWGDYIRGEGIMVLVIGFTTFVVTWLIGVPGALFLAVIAGLLEVIPTFGPIIATVPAVLVALFQGSTRFDMANWLFALVVIAAYILIQQLESNLIAPKVMGHSVRLPALVVLISITAGLQVAGVLGAILAVPTVASAKIALSYTWAKIQARDPWAGPADTS